MFWISYPPPHQETFALYLFCIARLRSISCRFAGMHRTHLHMQRLIRACNMLQELGPFHRLTL